MVKIGNFYYMLYITFCIIIFMFIYHILKDKETKKQKQFLQVILFLNLTLHFCKLLFNPYRDNLPQSIRKVSFENICAVSTLVFPFIYLSNSKNSIIKNYFYFIGVLGGGLAILIPTEAIDKSPFCFDTIRFYICHFVLIMVPLLSAKFGIIELDYKKSYFMPICFIIIEMVILINELILIKIGYVQCTDVSMFLDRDYRNSSFIFGPTSSFDGISKIITIFTPKIFKTDYFGLNNGIDFYFPILWLVIPAFIYLPIVNVVIGLPFTGKDIKKEIIEKKNKMEDKVC